MSWSKESSSSRGYGAAWRKMRLRVLARDKYLCVICKKSEAKEVDHIKEKAKGGTDDIENLQSLCVQCHKDKTNNRGFGCDSRGMPKDPNHHWNNEK